MQRSDTADWSEGRDGQQASYVERLHPPLAVFALVLALAVVVGAAYGAAYGSTWGWVTAAILGMVGVAGLLATSCVIRVDDRVVRAGRARLPHAAIAGARPLDADAMRQARRQGDPRDYLVLRAWSSRRGVAIDLADPRDPHPRWIVTSRHPDRLAEAIAQAITQAAGLAPATPPPGPPQDR